MAVQSDKSPKSEIVVRTGCTMHALGCRVNVVVNDGHITQVRTNPEDEKNGLCIRARGLMEWVYSEERLTSPLKRENGSWKQISWDDALSFTAERLLDIKEEYGARALVTHIGQALVRNVARMSAKRFCRAYGTPNFTSGDSFCYWCRSIGHSIALGIGDSAVNTDLENTNCILILGHNPSESSPPAEIAIRAAKARGARLIVIDPRVIPLAKEADIYAPIRPGTDCALELSLLNVIIEEKLYDKDFVANWTVGFDKLEEHVKAYAPKKVEGITWVPAQTIREIARTYALHKPATTYTGIAIDHCTSGAQTNWATAILMAMCGNYETRGGNYPTIRLIDIRGTDQVSSEGSIGYQYPVFSRVVGESTIIPMVDAILTGKPYPVKALIVQAGNPALTYPNTSRFRQAVQSLDLLVVMDLFMTETAKIADIVLPAATCLEESVLLDRGSYSPGVSLVKPVIKPLGECWSDWKFWTELGRMMGYADYFPWNNADEYFEYLLKPIDINLKQLKDDPLGMGDEPHTKDRSYRTNGFRTASKKVEIYSEAMKELGYDPLPTYREPAEGWITKPELAKQYPLILITGTRNKVYHHTQYRNIPSLRKLYPDPMVEINTRTAWELSINDGEMVTVESPRGSIKLKAHLTDDIHPKVVSVPHGWSEANVNILTYDLEVDPVSAFTGFKSVLCRIVKS
jgi:anaerobic selenocysteine-containing dehydrogenase